MQVTETIDVCVEDETVNYLNRRDVQRALHARLVGLNRWLVCSSILDYELLDLEIPTISTVGNIIKAGIPVLVYSLATDACCFPRLVWFPGVINEVMTEVSKDVPSSSSSIVAPSTSFVSSTHNPTTAFSAASLVLEKPAIKCGSSKIVSAQSTTSTSEATNMKAKSETGFGNLKSSPSKGASFAPGSGKSTFGFNSSVMSTATAGGTESQGFVVST